MVMQSSGLQVLSPNQDSGRGVRETAMETRDFTTGMDRTWWIVECRCLRKAIQVSGLPNLVDKLETEYTAGARFGIRKEEFSFERDDAVS